MSEARTHAVTASQLLENVESTQKRLEGLTPEQRLEMAASGQFPRLNADLKWTVDLALAHAIAAIALVVTDEVDEHDSGRPWP